MRAGALMIALAVIAGGTAAYAETHSDFSHEYNLTTLKTFDFKQQTRISRDPLANNEIWGGDIRKAIAANLKSKGMVQDDKEQPDFLVAYYVGLKDRYDVRSLGYGVPFYGRGFGGFWRWGGWPDSYDTWAVPYTEETLIIDIIDAKTNQLVWRGYNQDTLNLGKAEKDFTSAVNDVLKKFHSDAKKSAPRN
jgi:hypothetical protein